SRKALEVFLLQPRLPISAYQGPSIPSRHMGIPFQCSSTSSERTAIWPSHPVRATDNTAAVTAAHVFMSNRIRRGWAMLPSSPLLSLLLPLPLPPVPTGSIHLSVNAPL
ncbi:hypothetical protein Vafri_9101, partial [Volvox africanus]